MKIIALDIGEKRIGIASGDTEYGIAFPEKILMTDIFVTHTDLFEALRAFCQEKNAERVIVGHPAPLGEPGSEQTKKCRDFADDLEDFFVSQGFSCHVEFIDEGFSTQMAMRKLKDLGYEAKDQKKIKDALAAAEFLQTYLDTQKS